MNILVTITQAELDAQEMTAESLKADMVERLRMCECDGPFARELSPAILTVVVEG